MISPWVAIQSNPRSGSGIRHQHLQELVESLDSSGLNPILFQDRDELQKRLTAPEQKQSLLCLVAAGGDGTVNDVINRYQNVPITVFPLGTENLLAKYFQIPCSGKFVAEMIAGGDRIELDVGVVNQRKFLLMLSAGFDAEVVRRVDESRTGSISKWFYFQPIWNTLRKYKYPDFQISYPDPVDSSNRLQESGKLVFLMNCPAYANQLKIAKDADPTDGQFDLRLFRRGSFWYMIKYLIAILRDRHAQRTDVVSLAIDSLKIESEEPVPLQVDGDPAGFTPAEIHLIPQSQTFIVPAKTRNTD